MSKTKPKSNQGNKVCYQGYPVKIISVIIEYLDGECKGERVWLDPNEASLGLLQLK